MQSDPSHLRQIIHCGECRGRVRSIFNLPGCGCRNGSWGGSAGRHTVTTFFVGPRSLFPTPPPADEPQMLPESTRKVINGDGFDRFVMERGIATGMTDEGRTLQPVLYVCRAC